MLSCSKTAGYAVHALSCIGAALPRVSHIQEIAECTGLKRPYLAQIINQLGHRGLVEARRGQRGGVVLARSAQRISLFEIVQAVEGDAHTSPCLFGMERCPARGHCPAHARWAILRKQLEDVMRKTMLSDVIKTTPPAPNGHPRHHPAANGPLQDLKRVAGPRPGLPGKGPGVNGKSRAATQAKLSRKPVAKLSPSCTKALAT
jgi:Rrf2 family protein